jgi:hypothetical protein
MWLFLSEMSYHIDSKNNIHEEFPICLNFIVFIIILFPVSGR